jgi:hypothetical protein
MDLQTHSEKGSALVSLLVCDDDCDSVGDGHREGRADRHDCASPACSSAAMFEKLIWCTGAGNGHCVRAGTSAYASSNPQRQVLQRLPHPLLHPFDHS